MGVRKETFYFGYNSELHFFFLRFLGLLQYKHTIYNIYNTYPHINTHTYEYISPDLIPWLFTLNFNNKFQNKFSILSCFPQTLKMFALLKLISFPEICLINNDDSCPFQTFSNAFAWMLFKLPKFKSSEISTHHIFLMREVLHT